MSKLILKVIRLNVIIVSCNQSAQVYRLIKSIAGLIRPEQMRLGITVLDDGSSSVERSRLDLLREKGIEVLRNEHPRGWIFSVNRGCGNSKADWCWVISANATVDDKNSLKFIDAMARQAPAMILGHCRYLDDSPLAQALNWPIRQPDKLVARSAANPDCFVVNRETLISLSGLRSELILPELAMAGLMEEINQRWRSGKIAVSSGLFVSRSKAPDFDQWLHNSSEQGRIASTVFMPEYPLYYQRNRLNWLDQGHADKIWLLPWKLLLQLGYGRKVWFKKLSTMKKMPPFGHWLISKILWAVAFSAGTRTNEHHVARSPQGVKVSS